MHNTADVAAETADVLIAASDLPEDELHRALYVFSRMANRTADYTPTERELFHSVARLLARVRDIQERNEKRLRKMDRYASLRTHPAPDPEFDRIIASNF
jgi:hypothetical protein